MAGVYIPGMKLPKCCSKCGFYQWHYDSGWGQYEKCSANHVTCNDSYDKNAPRLDPFKEKLSTCPLVEVPDHGDLIDRDVLMKYKASAYDIDDHELYAVGTGTILRMPAVIPADKEEK